MIEKLSLQNFELFKSTDISFMKINVISGTNLDDAQASSNGSGKTTLAKNAITFVLFNDVSGINLKDLIQIGEKEAKVELIINKGNDKYKIIRTIPSGLTIYKNGVEVEGNTATIKQKYINDVFGDYEFFKKFRMIDTKGINLLDLGITSLRKELMNFVDDLFTGIRKNLLNDKLTRETYQKSKRLYQFSLSTERLNILEKGEINIKEKLNVLNKEMNALQTKYNTLDSGYLADKKNIITLTEDFEDNLKSIQNNTDVINANSKKGDVSSNTTNIEEEQSTIESMYQSLNEDRETLKKEIEELNMQEYSLQEKISRNTQESIRIHNEITGLDDITIGTECDKCGSIIDEAHKHSYRLKRNDNLEVLDSEQLKINTQLKTKELELDIKRNSLGELENSLVDLKNSLEENNKSIKSLNIAKEEEIKRQTMISAYTENRNSLITKNMFITEKIKKLKQDNLVAKEVLTKWASLLLADNEYLLSLQKTLHKTQEYLMKLKEAFKFIDYKYTSKDVLLYDESIKTLDAFAGHYINEWLKQLAVIINDLLKNINMQVEFNAERDFIKIKNGENELKFEQLSSGQKTFLSSVFKLAILLHNGENEGIIIADEGLGNLDAVNFIKFIDICKTLPFQLLVIYQNLPELEDINKINIVRQNGESKIQ